MADQAAMLLLGPTGSGKTPLGRLLEKEGFRKTRCFHFDFGGILRQVAAGGYKRLLDAAESAAVERSLLTGDLFERQDFSIARKILAHFMAERHIKKEDLLVLNGFPRNVDQALAVEDMAAIETVLNLETRESVILDRIRLNPAGDRIGRLDDTPEAVRNRLEIFWRRTKPLIEYYAQKGVPVITVAVHPLMSPEEMLGDILSPTKSNSRGGHPG